MHSTGWPPVPSMGDGCEDGSCADGSRADWLEPGGGLIDGTRSCGSFACRSQSESHERGVGRRRWWANSGRGDARVDARSGGRVGRRLGV